MASDWRPEAAEALGAFFLVLAGGGAILADAGALAVALAFGLTIAALIAALGHVSGAHFNPAITVAFAATRHFPWRRVPAYVAAQVLGALAAALLLTWWHGDIMATTTQVQGDLSWLQAVAIEVAATFLLAFVIIAVATDARAPSGLAGLVIGLAVVVNALWAGPLTGAGTNPARTIGPALVTGTWNHLGLYVAAPLVGAALAMLAYETLRHASKPRAGETLGALGPVELPGGGRT